MEMWQMQEENLEGYRYVGDIPEVQPCVVCLSTWQDLVHRHLCDACMVCP